MLERELKDIPSEDLESELKNKGYITVESSKTYADHLRNNFQTRVLIASYYYGNIFSHHTAYGFCALSEYWPKFCYSTKDSNFIYSFKQINSHSENTAIRDKFEVWFNTHRKVAAKKAAKILRIDWKEVEKYK